MPDNQHELNTQKDAEALEEMSVDELTEYRDLLQVTLENVNREIDRKTAYRESLDSVFK